MQTIFVDVTNRTKVDFLTGIQRVVGNLSLEMYKVIPDKLTFISFNEDISKFEVLDSDNFIKYIKGGEKERSRIFSGETISPRYSFSTDSARVSKAQRKKLSADFIASPSNAVFRNCTMLRRICTGKTSLEKLLRR